ncbi:MAG: metallophosphoesterase [Acidobacteriaceae bacterium]|nr:metallophosphoesterase [Acidobacteriaceae bacterium]
MPSVSRRKFLLTAGIAFTTLALAEDGVIREPNHPELVRLQMPLRRLPSAFDGFTIAQISDFHYDPVFSATPIHRAIEIVNRVRPDLVVLTGDFVTIPIYAANDDPKAAKAAEPCAKLLSGLHSRIGSIAVLGNHDVASDAAFVTGALEHHGIQVLCNRSFPIEQDGMRLWLCGLDSMARVPNLEHALDAVPNTEPAILLVHEPDFADEASGRPVDLQLSGHSHGGQIWLPGIGAPWLPLHARKYPRGRYDVRGLPVYTNIGLGTIRLPVRLNCTPEVTLITLRSQQANRSGQRRIYTTSDSG